jgi:hypothetical protein
MAHPITASGATRPENPAFEIMPLRSHARHGDEWSDVLGERLVLRQVALGRL